MDNSEIREGDVKTGGFADGGDIRGALLEAVWNLRSQLDWMAENGEREVPRPLLSPSMTSQGIHPPQGAKSSVSQASSVPLSTAFVTSAPAPASLSQRPELPKATSGAPALQSSNLSPQASPQQLPVSVAETLDALATYAARCSDCPMGASKTSVLLGNGVQKCDLMLVGDRPVVLPDGRVSLFEPEVLELLSKMIRAIGRDLNSVACIGAVQCACREEMHFLAPQKCRPILWTAVNLVRPKVVISLGKVATQALLNVPTPITRLRGVWQRCGEIQIMPTYHPAYLLKHVAAKREAWEDLKLVMKALSTP